MISRGAIDVRVREWGLRDEVVEKDYVLGWLLWGIGNHPTLGEQWIFKGGTCLKKCYIETYRFSEDLDFTVLPGGPLAPDDVAPLLAELLRSVGDESGIDFATREPRLRLRPDGSSAEGRVYYRGPRGAPTDASVKLDLSAHEVVARSGERRPIAHAYDPEALPPPSDVLCYAFEEVFAEKLRAMGERSRPRDLYDIINLYRRPDLRLRRDEIHAVLLEKCESKGVPVPTLASVRASERIAELESEWENMLGHQLPALPPFEQFWAELEHLFAWLEGTAVPTELDPAPEFTGEDQTWTPPPTVTTWNTRVPLEEIRFAAVNHLLVDLGYKGGHRLVEPYSLRRTSEGNLVLHTLRADSGEHRSYRVDRLESAKATNQPFVPNYAIEFSSAGAMAAPLQTRARSVARPMPLRSPAGPVHIVQCTVCGKQFRRKTMGTRLKAHNNQAGSPCPGRSAIYVGTR